MLPNIRKIYTAEAPDGSYDLYAEGSTIRAIHTAKTSWWTPDLVSDTRLLGLRLAQGGGNIEKGPGFSGKRGDRFRVVNSGSYTVKNLDGLFEPLGYVVTYFGNFPSYYRLGDEQPVKPIRLFAGDSISFEYDDDSKSNNLLVQRIA